MILGLENITVMWILVALAVILIIGGFIIKKLMKWLLIIGVVLLLIGLGVWYYF